MNSVRHSQQESKVFNKMQLKNLSQEELIELVLKTEKEKEEIQARFRGLSTIVINAFHNCNVKK